MSFLKLNTESKIKRMAEEKRFQRETIIQT